MADKAITTAVHLMRMALALLDKADEQMAACYLERAIGVATGVCVAKPTDVQPQSQEDSHC